MTFKLKEIRIKYKMRAKDIAKVLNMSDSNYSNLERGRIKLTFEDAILISDYLGCSIDELANRKSLNIDDLKKKEIVEHLQNAIKLLIE